MGFFDKLKKGFKVEWKAEKTWGQKPVRHEPERAPAPRAQSRYGRLAAWIKTTYGTRFREGVTSTEVETQLQKLLKELETTEDFKKYPKIANGFRAYISERKYGDLVKVTE